jgi:hypothetical protein
MNGILLFLRAKLPEVLKAIAPLVATVCILQLTLVHAPWPQFVQFLAGSLLAALGMLLLFAGIEHGILPMGRFIGAELPRKGSVGLIAAVAAAMGFVTTIAEPDVLILSTQVESVSGGRFSGQWLAYVIAGGVALFAAAALLRIVYGITMTKLLAAAFALVIALSLVSSPQFIPLAYDAGSVTTGLLSAPVLLALAIGVSSVLARHAGTLDGFGLLGLASIGPIVVVLLMGWLG